MSLDPTATDMTVLRQERTRAIREAVGLLVTTVVVGGLFLAPLVLALATALPQVVAALPEPVRVATVAWHGISGEEDVVPTDPDGSGEPEETPEVVEPVPDIPVEPVQVPVEPATPVEPPPAEDGRGEAEEAGADGVAEAGEAQDAPPAPETPAEAPKPKPKPEAEPAEPRPTEAERNQTVLEKLQQMHADKVAAVRAAEAAAKKKPGKCAEEHPDIVKLDDDTWRVKRSLIDHYTSSMERLNTLGYSRRYESDEDDEKGWLVGGFGCQSPLWKGGLRSQDVIQRVNGKKTYNVLQLVGIWISERNKKSFDIELLRKGQRVSLHYEVI